MTIVCSGAFVQLVVAAAELYYKYIFNLAALTAELLQIHLTLQKLSLSTSLSIPRSRAHGPPSPLQLKPLSSIV